MRKIRTSIPSLVAILYLMAGCREVSIPKPKGHFRIDLPTKEYRRLDPALMEKDLPFTFEYPVYGNIAFNTGVSGDPGWFNIEFPRYSAKIYLTYMAVSNDFEGLMEQTYRMNVKNHISRADAINEQVFTDSEKKVFGILYDLKGNTATSVQFYMTDSARHYLRGSLYFDAEPNEDSLAPVINFFREDIVRIIESLEWKN